MPYPLMSVDEDTLDEALGDLDEMTEILHESGLHALAHRLEAAVEKLESLFREN